MPTFLKTITLYNFKSYRGKVIIGLISPFTAIIGPNGSGKSNIMDAICFVLGEKSSALRVKRLGELIHGASMGEPTTESASVTATFMVDDNKEMNFTRMICNESSLYKIDDEVVTSKFYMNELRAYNLDIEQRNFLVSQGYIEYIALKTPREQTEMFEQFSGSNMYKADYDRFKMEYLKIKDEIHFAQHMKKQLLMQRKYTRTEKAEAEKYLMLKEQYMEEKSKYQSIRLFLIKGTIETLQNEERDIKSKMDKYLHNKRKVMHSLEHEKSRFKPLSNSLEATEQSILELENVIQEKKMEYAGFKENVLYWQKKYDCANVSLNSASKAHDTNIRNIQELKNEGEQIHNELVKLKKALQQDAIELSNSQVKHYLELKNEAGYRAKDFVEQINHLMCDQQMDQHKLDNENRKKLELEDKRRAREDTEKRHKKLLSSSAESRAVLMEKTAKRQELYHRITETKNKSLSLENDIAKVSEQLREIAVDNHMVSRRMEKTERIRMLEQSFSGVHGRLSSLCKPIHPRYNIAVIKVFGKNMDAIVVDTTLIARQCIKFLKQKEIGVETFLPLDSLKAKASKEKLRSIKEPTNVKLLYDVLDISSTRVNKAVLFVTKNILVCETAEDARKLAYDQRTNYDCVSLDGCFYRKDGTMSGGQADLIVRAKQWDEQQISGLQEQKACLLRELRDLPKISLMQSELNEADIQINGLNLKNEFIEKDLKDIEKKIARMRELNVQDMELSLLNEIIAEIQYNMQARSEKIKDIQRHVHAIEEEIFIDFCRDINVPDISYYEKNNLRTYQEQEKRRLELEKQFDRIQNQSCFENERDTKSKISKWKRAIKQAETKLSEEYQRESYTKNVIEQEERKLLELQEKCATSKEDLAEVEIKMAECRSQIGFISRSYLETRKLHIIIQGRIEKEQTESSIIIKECKMEDITIPMLLRRGHGNSNPISSSSSSNISKECSSNLKISLIDFSRFPEDILNGSKESLQDIAKQLPEKLVEIQNEIKDITDPNLKAHEKMASVTEQIQEINTKLQELRKKFSEIEAQFEMVKAKRYQLFWDFLERVATEIDSIYKILVNDTSAQAFVLADNIEEPYAGGINYSCIAPSKRLQPLQHLSGGEKTLASLALLLAIQRCKPTPIFFMDEGDAVLDNKNIENIIRFIRSRMNAVQFIAISLQRSFYSRADALIGVTIQPDETYPESAVFAISLDGYYDPDEQMDVS